MAVNKWSLPELASALATLSADDRAYVERMADDFKPRRRRRRKNAKKTAARKAKAASSTKRNKKAAKSSGNGRSKESVADATLMRTPRRPAAEQ